MRASTGSSHSRSSIASLHDLIYEINASLSGANSAGPSVAGSAAPNRDSLQHSQPPSSNGRSSGTWRATSELGYYYSDTGDSTASAQPPAAGIKIQQQPARSSTSSDGIGQYSQQQGTGWENDGSLNSSYNGGMLGGGPRRSSIGSYTADSPPPDSVQEADPQGQEAAIAAADVPQQEAPAETSTPALLSLPSTNSRRSASGPRLTAIAEESSSCASTPSAMTANDSGGRGTGSAAFFRFQSGGSTTASAAPWSVVQAVTAAAVGNDSGLTNSAEPCRSSRTSASSSEGAPPEQETLQICTTASRALSSSATSSGSGGSMGVRAQHNRPHAKQAEAQHRSQNGSTSEHSLSGGYPATSTNPSQAGSASHVILSNGQVVLAGTDLLVPPSPTTADMTAHLHDADPVDSWVASQAAALLPAPAWDKQRHQHHRQLQKTASVAYGGAAVDSPTYAWSSGLSSMYQQQQQQELGAAAADPESQEQQGEQHNYTDEAQLDTGVLAADPTQVTAVVTAAAAPATPIKTNNLTTPATSVVSIASSSKQRSSLSGWLGSKAPSYSGGSETEHSAENGQQQQQPGRRWPGNLGITAARQSSSNRRQSLMRESTSNSFHLQNGLPGWGAPPETPAFAGRSKRINIPWDAQRASLDSVDRPQGQQLQQQQHDQQQQLLQSDQPPLQLLDGNEPADEWREGSLEVSQTALCVTTHTQQHQDAAAFDHSNELLQQSQHQQQQEQPITCVQPDAVQRALVVASQPKEINLHHALLSALNPLEYALWQQRQHQRTLLDRALHALTSLQADVDTLVAANQSAAVQAAAAAQCRDLVQELQQQLLSVQQQKVTGSLTDSKRGDDINSKAAADGVVSSNEPWTIKAGWMPQIDHNQAGQVEAGEGPPSTAVAAAGRDDAVDDFEAELLRLEAAAPGRRLSEETLRTYYALHGMTDDGHDIVSQQQQQQQAQLAADDVLCEQQQDGVKDSPAVEAAEISQQPGQPGELPQEQLQQESQPSGGVGGKMDDIEALLLALEAAIPGHGMSADTAAVKAAEETVATNNSSDIIHEADHEAGQHELQQKVTESVEPADPAAVATTATAAAQANVLDDFEAELLAAESAEPGRRISAEAVAEHEVGSETRQQQQQQQWAQETLGLPDGPIVDVTLPSVTFQLPSSELEVVTNSSAVAEHSGMAVTASSIDDFEQELMALEAAAAAAAGVQLHHNASSGGSSSGNDDGDELARLQGGEISGQVADQHVSESATDPNAAHAQDSAAAGAEQKMEQQDGARIDGVAVMTSDDGIGMFAGSSSWPTHEDSHAAARNTTTNAANGGGKHDIAAPAANSIAIGTFGSTSNNIFGGSNSVPGGVDYNHGEGDGHSRNTQHEDPIGTDSASSSDDFEAMMRANETAAKAAAGRSTAAATAAEDRWWEAEDGVERSEQPDEVTRSPTLDVLQQPAEAKQQSQPQGQPRQETNESPPPAAPHVTVLKEQQLQPGSISFDSTAAALATPTPPPAPAASSGGHISDSLIDLALDFGHVGSVGGDVAGVPLSPRTAATSGIREFDWLARIVDEAESGDTAEGSQPGGGIAAPSVYEEQQYMPGVGQQGQESQQQEMSECVVQHDVSTADGRQQPGTGEAAEQVAALPDLPCSNSVDLAVTAAVAEAQNETAAVSAAAESAASNSTTDSKIPGAAACSVAVELLTDCSSSNCGIGREYAISGSSGSSSSTGGSEATQLEVPADQQLLAEAIAAANDVNLAAVAAVTADTTAVAPGHMVEQQQQAQPAMLTSTEPPSAPPPSAPAETAAAVPQAVTGSLAVQLAAQTQQLVSHATSTLPAGPSSSSPQLEHQGVMPGYSHSAFGSDIKPISSGDWGLDYSPSARPATAPGQLGSHESFAASSCAASVGGNSPTAAAATEFSRISLQALEEVTRSVLAAAAAARTAREQEARLASVGGSCASVPASHSNQSLGGLDAPAAVAGCFASSSCRSHGSPQKAAPAAVLPAANFKPGSHSGSLTGRGSETGGSRPQSLFGAAAAAASVLVDSSCDGRGNPQTAAGAAAAAWLPASIKQSSPCSSITGQGSDTSGRSRLQSHLGASAAAASVHVDSSCDSHGSPQATAGAEAAAAAAAVWPVKPGSSCSSITGQGSDISGRSRPPSLLGASAATANVLADSSCGGHGSPQTAAAEAAAAAAAAVWPSASFEPGSPCSSVTGQGSDTSGRSRLQSLLGSSAMSQPYPSQPLQQQRTELGAREGGHCSSNSSGSGHRQPCVGGFFRSSSGGIGERSHVEPEREQHHEQQPQHQQQHADEHALLNSTAAQHDRSLQGSAHAGDVVGYGQQSTARHQHSNGVAGQSHGGSQVWPRVEALGSAAVASASSSTGNSRPSTAPAVSSSAGTATNRPLGELSQQHHQAHHQQHQAQQFDNTAHDLSVASQHLLSRTDSSSSSVVSDIDDSSDPESLSTSEQPLPHHTAWLFASAAADAGAMSLQSRPSTSAGLDSKRCSVNGWTAVNPPLSFLHMPSSQPKGQQNATTSPGKPAHRSSSSGKQFGSKYITSQLRMIDHELGNLEKLASRDMHEQQRLREELQQQRELWQQQLQLAEQQLRYEADSEAQQPAQQQQWEVDMQRAALFGRRGVPSVPALPAVGNAGAAGGGNLNGHEHSPQASGCGLCQRRSIQHTYDHAWHHAWRGSEDLGYLRHRAHRDQQLAGYGADKSPVHSSMWICPGRLADTCPLGRSYAARSNAGHKVRPYSAGSVYGVRTAGAARQFGNHTSTTQILRLDYTVQQPGHLYGQPIEHWVLPHGLEAGEYPSTCAPLPPTTPEQRTPVAAAAPRVGEALTSPARVTSCCQAVLQHRPWTAGALQNTAVGFHGVLHVPSRYASKVAASSNLSNSGSHASLWREVALECELEAVEQALLRTEVVGVAAETRVVSAALQSSLHLLL